MEPLNIKNPRYNAVVIVLLLVVIGFSVYFISNNVQKRDANLAQVFTVEVGGTTTVGTDLPSTVPGVNIDSTFNNTDTDASAFTQLFQSAGIHAIQLTAGTTARFTHLVEPDGSMPDGLGVLTSEITRDGASPNKDTEASWTTSSGFSFYSKYRSLVQNVGAQAFPALNVDSTIAPGLPGSNTGDLSARLDATSIALASGEDTAVVNDLKSHNIPIMGVRLGAEDWLKKDSNIYPTGEDFMTRVVPIANAIKAVDSNIKVYFHGAPYDANNSRGHDWNSAMTAHASSYDGVIVYSFLDPTVYSCTGSIANMFSCMNSASKGYISGTWHAQMDGTKSAFPGKLIAITQHNLKTAGDSYDTGSDNVTTYSNSLLQGIHVARQLLAVASYDANNNNVITYAGLMSTGGGNATSDPKNLMSNYQSNTTDLGNVVSNGGLVCRTACQAYHLVNGIFDDHHKLLNITYSVPGIENSDFEVYGFLGDSGDRIFEIINDTATAVPLESITVNNQPFKGTGSFTIESMSGSALSSTYGHGGSMNTSFSPITLSGPTGYLSTSGVTIPGYSITQIKIPESGDHIAPSVPTNLHSEGVTASTVTLAWDGSTDNTGVSSYLVYENNGSDPIATLTDGSTSYTVTGITPNTAYTFQVAAEDGFGNISGKSAVFTLTSADTIPPSVPTALTASNITSTSFTFSWTASTDNLPGQIQYKISRGGVSNGNETIATTTDTSYVITGLTPNHPYRFTVKAVDISNNASANARSVMFTTLAH